MAKKRKIKKFISSTIEGRIDRRGFKTYLLPDDGGDPIFIPERKTNRSIAGDRVVACLYASRRGLQPEAEVIDILERTRTSFVGQLEVSGRLAFLITSNQVMTPDIFIPPAKLHGAKNGQMVVVKMLHWREDDINPVGEVVDILGDKGENNAEMHAILAEFGLPYTYPHEVEEAAEKISDSIPASELKRRLDMRDVATFTIDPADAKDFDDALSLKVNDDGTYQVGVHIADVTHYVKLGDIIDREASSRATSVYLVDRTVPMLPERLCNNICSLRPDEDKLTFSVIFTMDSQAKVLDYRIAKTVIRSNRRFAYEEAQQVIETAMGDYVAEILCLNELAQKLRAQRFAAGALDIERSEPKFEIDEKGKPLSVYFKEAQEANQLIEEFMLLANRTVAQHIGKPGRGRKIKPFVYRVHALPDNFKFQKLSHFIKRFGYKVKTQGSRQTVTESINGVLNKVKGKAEQDLITSLILKSMAKAVYSTDNIGHYGLAFDFYTHFTSPIRRYPDVLVHRLLSEYIDSCREPNHKSVTDKSQLEDLCKHCSNREQLAANAERASIKYKQVEYMQQFVGQEFDGVISGVTEWGLYVELKDNGIEGMVPIRDLNDDYYVFDEDNYCLVGRSSGRTYQLSSPIRIRVVEANLNKKQLDFELA
ncbi:MAG: ribonuclease R [Paludibacteraceae bacterium]|nr:ribonuclease R [Paludibacteraceae bacterium]